MIDFSYLTKQMTIEAPKINTEQEGTRGFLDNFQNSVINDKLKGVENNLISQEKKEHLEEQSIQTMNKIGDVFKIQIPFLGDLGTLFGKKRPIDLLGSKKERSKNKVLNGILKLFGFKKGMEEVHEKYIESQLEGVDKQFAQDCFKEYSQANNPDVPDDQSTRKICGLDKQFSQLKEEDLNTLQSKIPADFSSLKESLLKQLPNHINKLSISTVNMIDPSLIISENNENKIDIAKIQANQSDFIDKYLKTTIPLFANSGEEFIASPNIDANGFAYALFGNLTGEKFFVEGVSLGLLAAPKTNEQYYSYNYANEDITQYDGEIKKENTKYSEIVSTVIEKIEGGYYNPKTMYTARMGKSGETMMGIDRRHGGALNNSPAGKEFWRLIDEDKAKNPDARKKHGYTGGSLEPKLRSLAGEIIKPHYENLCKKYLSDESIKIINTDGRLMFNFIYGARNGAGWFQKMANELNNKVATGVKNTDQLTQTIVDRRIHKSGNSLIAQGGKKIEEIVGLAA